MDWCVRSPPISVLEHQGEIESLQNTEITLCPFIQISISACLVGLFALFYYPLCAPKQSHLPLITQYILLIHEMIQTLPIGVF